MKAKLILMMMLISGITFSQDQLEFKTEIQAQGTQQSKLNAVLLWFATTYNSSKEVVQYSDTNHVVGKALFGYDYGKMSYDCFDGVVRYMIQIRIHKDHIELILNSFFHDNSYGSSKCQLGKINTNEDFTDKGASKKYQNNTWRDIKQKAGEEFDEIKLSLQMSF